jgi:hypothetical protein
VVTVPANTVLELDDDFFDRDEQTPSEAEWVRVDAAGHEVCLDDDVSTLRLANRQVLAALHGDETHPLVTWTGYNAESYKLVLHADDDSSGGKDFEANQLSWVAWDYRTWRTYLFNGGKMTPISEAGEVTAQLATALDKITWMGWDGEGLDIFTSDASQMGETIAAVFIGKDGSVLAVHRK